MTQKLSGKCPSCERTFTKSRSNQRYCSTQCGQYAKDIRRGKTRRAAPAERQKRIHKRAGSAGGNRQTVPTYLKRWNDPELSNHFNDLQGHFAGSRVPLERIEMDHIVSITPTPLLKLPEDLSDWGLEVLPQSSGRFLVTDVSKVPEKVLYLLGDKRAVNAVRAAYKALGTDAGEYIKGTGHSLSDLELKAMKIDRKTSHLTCARWA